MLDTHYNCMFNSSSIHKKFNFSNSYVSSLHALELYLYNFKKEINKNNHFIDQKCSPPTIMSQNNYFKMIIAYPVMICTSVLCQGAVGCDQLPFLERVPKRSYFVQNKQ